MSVKNLVRPIPGARRLPLLRQRLRFTGTASYWERRYVTGGTSGAGSYGEFGAAKAEFLNTFVSEHRVRSVVEFGCGDGRFSSWVEANHPQWRLAQVTRGPLLADFFVYERSGGDAARPSAGTPDAAPAG